MFVRRVCWCAATVGLWWLAAPNSAGAVVTWSAPVEVAHAVGPMDALSVASASGGAALLEWSTRNSGRPNRMAWRLPSGAIVPAGAFGGTPAGPAVEVAPDVFAVVRTRPAGAGRAQTRVSVEIAFLHTGGRVGRFRRLGTAVPAVDLLSGAIAPAAGADGHGKIAVAWTEQDAHIGPGGVLRGFSRVRLTTGRLDGRFAPVRTLARRPPNALGPLALAYGRAGRLLVAFAALRRHGPERGAIFARLARPGGRLEPPQSVGPADSSWGIDLHAAANPRGTMSIAWGSRFLDECPVGAKQVRAAVRAAGESSFAPARLLGQGARGTCESRTIDLVLDGSGRSTVGWSMWDASGQRMVHVADLTAGGAVAARATLGVGDFGDLALGRDGAALASWDDGTDGLSFADGPSGFGSLPPGVARGHTLAALRPAEEATFEPAEVVSAADEDASPGAVTFLPDGGPALAWWSYQLQGDPPAMVTGEPAALRTAIGTAG